MTMKEKDTSALTPVGVVVTTSKYNDVGGDVVARTYAFPPIPVTMIE